MSRTRGHNVRRYDGHKLFLAQKAARKVRPSQEDSDALTDARSTPAPSTFTKRSE